MGLPGLRVRVRVILRTETRLGQSHIRGWPGTGVEINLETVMVTGSAQFDGRGRLRNFYEDGMVSGSRYDDKVPGRVWARPRPWFGVGSNRGQNQLRIWIGFRATPAPCRSQSTFRL
ncbi:hypothetical protein TIFTF001_002886 [Ficus carica]|uniref:Uncharacterized protein n=1 Tax=Ficus carica TaxID=3494 RepID=A0AA87ZCZ3_FICCA|nr:hypothetical protein TIFTF001_002886 [Ficus carica]